MRFVGQVSSVLLVLILMMGCGAKMTEEQLRAKALEFENTEQWDEAIEAYEKLASKYKEADKRDETLYKLGMLYANHQKDYEKSWEQMPSEEKEEFNRLREIVLQKIVHGVKNAGGDFQVQRPSDGKHSGSVFGKWTLPHKTHSKLMIWDVRFNTRTTGLAMPRIYIYISHTHYSD